MPVVEVTREYLKKSRKGMREIEASLSLLRE
jgi:hypothetical protein